MRLLYSDIIPLGLQEGQATILDCFHEQIAACDGVDIAVGYVSKAALEELDALISAYHLKHIHLIMGMYYIEGMPETTYRTALALNEKWQVSGVGEIRVVRAFKYHGKVYAFHKAGEVKSAIIGSANLGAIKLEADNRRQYEVACLTTSPAECREVAAFIRRLGDNCCSANLSDITNMPLIRAVNTSLTGIDAVEQIPKTETAIYERHKTDISFILPIKVPAFAERHMDDNKHYTKSNLNVCYAAPRSAGKSRNWYETQLTVNKNITKLSGYPVKMLLFML